MACRPIIGRGKMDNIRLKSGVDFFISAHSKSLIISPTFGTSTFQINEPYDLAWQMLKTLSEPISVANLKKRFRSDDPSSFDVFLNFLAEKRLITSQSNDSQLNNHDTIKYKRQMAYFEQSETFSEEPSRCQKGLATKSIAIIGCGGAGAPIAELLAASGIGAIKLIDGDTIELSNLGRQIAYDEQDIGQPKTICLSKRLKRINPDIAVKTTECFVTEENMRGVLSENDFTVVAADWPMPDLLYWVDNVSFKNQTCYACISNSLPTIRIGPIFDPSKSLCYQKYENALEQKWPEVIEYERVANSCEYNKSATPWACYSAASILVGQIIQKLLTGHSALDGKTFLLNLETLVARKGIEI